MNPFDLIFKTAKYIAKNGKTTIPDFVKGQGAFKADSNLGIARNTVLGIPGAAWKGSKFIADTLTEIPGVVARTSVGFGGDVRNVFVPESKKVFEAPTPKFLKALPGYGSEPTKTLAARTASGEQTLEKFGVNKKLALPLAFAGTIGSASLDLTPFGGLEKNAVKSLVKAETPELVAKILRTMKVPEEQIAKHVASFVAAKTPEEVKSALSIVRKEISPRSFADFHPEDQKFLSDYAARVKAGNGALPKNTQIAKETLESYGLSVPEDIKQMADQIETLKLGADNAAEVAFGKSMDQSANKTFTTSAERQVKKPITLAEIRAKKIPTNRGFAKNPLANLGGKGEAQPKLPLSVAKEEVNRVVESGASLNRSIAQRKGITSDPLETLKNVENRTGVKPVRYSSEGIPLAPTKRQSELMKAAQEAGTTRVSPLQSAAQTTKSLADDVSTGELRSIERQAEQAATREIRDPQLRKSSSLTKIVEKSPTPVKAKVNALDYLRTPDNVLKKIGLSKQAATVRRSYEAYVKELPKNIDKISEWVKRVPKESNQRIFKYLDGQAVDISSEEMAVASEIKTWLKEWADRLDLPEDNRIADYITHIFDDQLIKKEFDEDLAKIIAEKVPGSVYNPFLEKRLGAKGYREDVWAALDAYVKRATRKVHMDPALEQLQTAAGHLEESQWNYVKRFADRINLRPTELDNIIDNGIKSILGYRAGQRPVATITRTLRRATYRGMLGLNPGSALRNLSQGINTYAKLGEKYTAIGYSKLFSPASRAEIEASGILSSTFVQDRALSSAKKALEKADKALFYMFDTVEKINRGAAYLGAKAKGIAQGMSETDAIEYAKKIVRDTQFQFGTIDTPVGMSSDIVKTLTQFQGFTTKQIEFLAGMAKNKEYAGLIRYVLSGAAFVYTVGQAFGMEIKDLVPAYRIGTPPSLRLPGAIIGAVTDMPDKYGQPRTTSQKLGDIAATLPGYIPAGNQLKKTFQGVKAIKEGGSYDAAGRLQFTQGQSTSEKIQAVLFGKYVSNEAQDYFNRAEISKEEKKRVQPVYDRIQELLANGDQQTALDIHSSLSEEDKATYKKIKSVASAEKNKEGKKAILPVYNKVQKLLKDGNKEEALRLHSSLTDEEKGYYKMVKSDFSKAESKPEYDQNIVSRYVEAVVKDPANALRALFTKEKLGMVEGNLVELQRFYGIPYNDKGGSQEYKKKRMTEMGIPLSKIKEYKLEHIVPVSAGGSNADSNLIPINNIEHNYYTPFDIAIGNAVKLGKIDRKEAERLSRGLKVTHNLTAEDIMSALK